MDSPWRKNRPLSKNNKSGYAGVFFNPRSGMWKAVIQFHGEVFYLGLFREKKDAVRARKKKEAEFDALREKELIGRKFGRLTILKKTAEKSFSGAYLYRCKCECGKTITASLSNLKTKNVISCGCAFKESSKELNSRLEFYDGTNISKIKSKKRQKNNTSGYTGVSLNPRSKKWDACIYLRGKTIHLGQFKRIEDAIRARKNAELEYFKPLIEEYKDISLPSWFQPTRRRRNI
jgi:hypothetical protein